MTELMAGRSLRRVLTDAAAASGCPMKDLTVLAPKNDPFRVDTPAGHRDGKWLADTAAGLGLGDRRIHLRGLHYMVLGRPKPDGSPYVNDDDHWEWLQGDAAKAARFLGYIPFDQITDKRNAEPVIQVRDRRPVTAYLTTELDVSLPEAWELEPQVEVDGFTADQPYRLALVGEKSSLAEILKPVAAEHQADLYLPTGEISDTQIYLMAEAAREDGRPLVLLYFSDFDPAGWQMGISVARKLQAMQVLLPGMPDFEVHRVALTLAQVREYGLPSTPLKASEKRADKWRLAWGAEQTEIDALAALRPQLLRQIARDAIAPFYDATLDRRVFQARSDWIDEAQDTVERSTDSGQLEVIRAAAAAQLEDMRQQIRELNDSLRIDTGDLFLPPFDIPQAVAGDRPAPAPLLDSRWDFTDQCRRLIASKTYETVTVVGVAPRE
jgi:hypothetical protein